MSLQAASEYVERIESWRTDMDYKLRAAGPGGWLAIVGMYPLRFGINTVGSADGSDVALPANSAPQRIGTIEFRDQQWVLVVTTDEVVTVDQEPVLAAKLRTYNDVGGMSVIQIREVSFGIQQWASDPINVRVWDANSPKRLNFPGRSWYPIDPKLRVIGRFTPYISARELTVEHTGGQSQELRNIGFIEFAVNGTRFQFEACEYATGDGYIWLLMRDGTTGASTYGSGRFLSASVSDDGFVDLDFNTLYHPPCAFCDFTTCPMPPPGNVIPFAIEAGERYP